jgi:hypothetical protein
VSGMSAPGIFLAALLSALAIWALIRLPGLHPAQLWAVPWALATDLYCIHLLPYRSISWATAGIAGGAAVGFAVAACFGGSWRRSSGRAQLRSASYSDVSRIAAVAVAALCAVLLAYLVQAIAICGLRNTFVSSAQLRIAIAHGDLRFTIKYVYFALAAVALSAAAAGLAPTGRARRMWLGVTVASVASLYFATGRATIITGAIIGLASFCLIVPRAFRKRTVLLSAAGFVAVVLFVFVSVGALIGKTFANNPDLNRIPSVFVRHHDIAALALPYEYASAPIAALGVQVHAATTWGEGHGCALFQFICQGLRDVGVAAPDIPRVRPFTASPLRWNTYTALDLPLIDGGKALTIPLIAVIGFLSGLLWRSVRKRELFGVIAYAIESAALLSASGSFNFTAPDLLGGFIIACGASQVVRLFGGLSSRRPAADGRPQSPPPLIDS